MVKKIIQEGDNFLNKNNLNGAKEAYNNALKLDPNAAKAYHALGNVVLQENKLDEAISNFRKAIEIQPDLSSSRYKLAEILFKRGILDEALNNYQIAVKGEPNSWKYYNGLANILMEKEQWQEAIDAYQKVIELNPSCFEACRNLKTLQRKLDLGANINELNDCSQIIIKPKLSNNGSISILFILPVKGGSGGAHSVVQECLALYRCGIKVQIAVNKPNYSKFLTTYSDVAEISNIVVVYESLNDIKIIVRNFSVVCATIFSSVNILREIVKTENKFLPAYYIQDYEILFSEKDSPKWQEAWDSYNFIPGGVLFAKTKWLCEVIGKNHNCIVHKVEPSIDHEVYYPDLNTQSDKIKISMMVRFATPRRAAKRTLRIAYQLSCMFPHQVSFTMFGSRVEDIKDSGIAIPKNATIMDHLTRHEVADVLRKSDIFCDFSDYQAFGRTALEAMACGCISVVPERGGANEYAIDNVNSLVVNTTDEEGCVEKISKIVNLCQSELYQMKINALETANKYSKQRAAFSILNLFHNQVLKLKS
jgi:tetratricopeptide (TPR) repeat protein